MSTRRAGWCCLLALAATVSGGAAPAADEPPAEVPAEVLEVAQAVVGAIRADDLRAVAPWTVADEGEFDVEWLLDEDDDSRLMFSAAMLLYHPPGVVTDVGEPEQVEDGLVVYPLRKRFDETLHLVLLNTDDGWRWHLAATARATGRLATAGDADLAPPETLEPDALVARFQARVARGNLPVTTMPWLDDLGAPLLTDHSRTLVEELADIHGEGDAPMLLAMMYGLTWSPESERTLGEPRPLRLPENTPAWTVPMTSHFDLPLRLVVRREDGAWRLDLWNSARLSIGWPLEAPGEVLLPGRETAEQSLNNLKQLGLAMMM